MKVFLIAIGLILCSCTRIIYSDITIEQSEANLARCKANQKAMIEAVIEYRQAVQKLQNACQ